jgi:hypothetical protein
MSSNAPVMTLVTLGILITVLGLFVAGNLGMAAMGLAAVAAAGLLSALAGRPS